MTRTAVAVETPDGTCRATLHTPDGEGSWPGVLYYPDAGGVRETFTVRKVSFGVGVERTFPVHTPIIEKIEVVTRGDVRRAKLYYLRDLRGKAARLKTDVARQEVDRAAAREGRDARRRAAPAEETQS